MNTIVHKNYVSFDDLRRDFEWLSHNCLAIHQNNKDIVSAAKCLVKMFEEEVYNLTLCRNCYENAYNNPENSFPLTCNPPHLLLWVNCGAYGYWPSKLMKCDNDGVTVRYFGDYTNSTVSPTECIIFTEEKPDSGQIVDSNPSFDLALRVSF